LLQFWSIYCYFKAELQKPENGKTVQLTTFTPCSHQKISLLRERDEGLAVVSREVFWERDHLNAASGHLKVLLIATIRLRNDCLG